MRIIHTEDQSKLVEYEDNGQLKRVIMPVNSDDFDLAIPYGLPFALLLKQSGHSSEDASQIEQKLHKAGIWTMNDVEQMPGLVQSLGLDLSLINKPQIPNLGQLDWNDIQMRLADLLKNKQIFTFEDIQKKQTEYQWCLRTALNKPILELYRRYTE